MGIMDLSESELIEYIQLIEKLEEHEKKNLYQFLYPEHDITLTPGVFPSTHKIFDGVEVIYNKNNYPKHLEFWEKGATYHQRLFRAGNRVGKTVAACLEVMFHTTGLYPTWWKGKRFTTCNDWWVVGVAQKTIKEIFVPYFLGKFGDFGSALIPYDHIDHDSLPDIKKTSSSIDSFRIKHVNGTFSSITFKSYEQSVDSFMGTAVNILLDEEPPIEIYRECLMRTATGKNILIMTFTPLKGNSEMIQSWFPNGDVLAEGDLGDSKWVTAAAMDDVLHLNEEKIQSILAAYPAFQRKARRYGHPTLEEGAIFPYDESLYVIEPFSIPKHWPKAYGFDVGGKTAAVWIALDRESNTIYTFSDMKIIDGMPSAHAESIRARGKWMRGAIDTSSRSRSPTDGEVLFNKYKELGLNLVNANKAVEASIYEIGELILQGRLKVFNTCQSLIKEIRTYRRDKNGRIVKIDDHNIDAWRYAILTRDKILWTEIEANAANAPQEFEMLTVNSDDSWMIN